MTQPTYNDVDHGQASWDADLQANIDVQRVSVVVPEYADFASLPAANANDNCLASTSDDNRMYKSNGTVWHPVDGVLHSITADVTVNTSAGTEDDLDTYTLPADTNDKDGNVLSLTSDISDTSASDAVDYRFRIGGTLIATHTTNNNSARVLFQSHITRRGASGAGSARWWVKFLEFNSSGALVDESFEFGETSIDWTSSQVLKLTAQETAMGSLDIDQHQFLVELKR